MYGGRILLPKIRFEAIPLRMLLDLRDEDELPF